MRHLVLAVVERAVPRLAPAASLLLLGLFSSPREVGLYSLATLGYTLLQAVSEGAIRQALPDAVVSKDGLAFMRRYQRVAVVLGPTLLLCYIVIAGGLAGASGSEIAQLVPIAFAPAVTAIGINAVGRLQVSGHWSILARGQVVASLVALPVGAGVLVMTRSLIGGSVALLLLECLIAAWNIFHAPLLAVSDSTFSAAIVRNLSIYSLLSWLQGQADRLFLGVFGGAALLGSYSLGLALSRSAGDATAAATANVLRARFAGDAYAGRDRTLYGGLMLSVVMTAMAFGASYFLVLPVLGSEWRGIADVIPVLSLCALPAVLNWSAAVLHFKAGSTARALVAPAIGIAMGIAVGVGAMHSLNVAAWISVAREVLVVTATYGLLGRRAPWKPYCVMLLIIAVFGLFIVGV